MTPEEKARLVIDEKLQQSGWIIQDMKKLNLSTSLGVAVREFPTSTGEVDYALFVDGRPVGIIEAKREEAGESITDVEVQSGRYAHSLSLIHIYNALTNRAALLSPRGPSLALRAIHLVPHPA